MELTMIAQKWEERLHPMFGDRLYQHGENKIKFTLSRTELKELFDIGGREQMALSVFKEKFLEPVVAIFKRQGWKISYGRSTTDLRFLGLTFTITRPSQRRPLSFISSKTPRLPKEIDYDTRALQEAFGGGHATHCQQLDAIAVSRDIKRLQWHLHAQLNNSFLPTFYECLPELKREHLHKIAALRKRLTTLGYPPEEVDKKPLTA